MLIINLRNRMQAVAVLFFMLGSIVLIPNLAIAIPVFTITPTISPIVLKPNMKTYYPIRFHVKNNSGSAIPGLTFEGNYLSSPLLSVKLASGANPCIPNITLLKNDSCNLYLEITTGDIAGITKISPRICGFGGFICSRAPVEVDITNGILPVSLQASVPVALPSDTEVDRTYPVNFTFTNLNTTLPATSVSLVKNLPNFTQTIDTCGEQIEPQSSCQIAGNYKPTTTGGPVSLSVALHYREGVPVKITTSTTVTDVAVQGAVSAPLPSDTEVDRTYPVKFTFTNPNTKLPATSVSLVKNLPNFTQTIDTCGEQIEPQSSCQIAGNYKPTTTGGPVSLSVALHYREGVPVKITTSTTVTDVAVQGAVSAPLPSDTEVDRTYPVKFTFTNPNTKLPATSVSLVKNLPNFTQTIDTCGEQIEPQSSCQIAGNYKPTTTGGPVSLSVALHYREGVPVTLESAVVSVFFSDSSIIGGGYGYTSQENPVGAKVVNNADELRVALSAGNKKIYIPDNVVITLQNMPNQLSIPSGTKIFSDRGAGINKLGGLISIVGTNSLTTSYVVIKGDNIQLSDLRLSGPSATDTLAYCFSGNDDVIKNIELYHCHLVGLSLYGKSSVSYSYIHNNEKDHYGYGVFPRTNSEVSIDHNLFKENRHAIALQGGSAGGSYLADRNLTFRGIKTHIFDAHQTNGISGKFISFTHNIFYYPQANYGWYTAIGILGLPTDGAPHIKNNYFQSPLEFIDSSGRNKRSIYLGGGIPSDVTLEKDNYFDIANNMSSTCQDSVCTLTMVINGKDITAAYHDPNTSLIQLPIRYPGH